jgi:hypothetical protein
MQRSYGHSRLANLPDVALPNDGHPTAYLAVNLNF